MKTRVAKIVQEEKIELFEEEIPVLQNNQVLVKIEASGICGSDLHFFRHCGLGSFKENLPINIGHESSGVVIESCDKLFSAGDKVAIEPGMNCGQCTYCHHGLFNLCKNIKFLGANDVGTFRDYIVLEPQRLMKIDCSYKKGALFEPIGVALHAVDLVHCKLDDWVAVLGAGTIGLCLLSVLKKIGCKVAMLDPLQYRLDFAKYQFQADEVWQNNANINLDNLKNRFRVVFDAVGTQDSLDKSVRLVAANGEVCIIGIPEVDLLAINPHQMRIKELAIKSSRRSNQQLEKAYSVYQNDVT
jgi:L-iditol 2-dehydrogenase